MDPYGSKIFEGATKEETADLIRNYENERNLRIAERNERDLLRRKKIEEKHLGVGGRVIWNSKTQGTYRKGNQMGIEGIEQLGSSGGEPDEPAEVDARPGEPDYPGTASPPSVPTPDLTPPGGDNPVPAPDTSPPAPEEPFRPPFEQGQPVTDSDPGDE